MGAISLGTTVANVASEAAQGEMTFEKFGSALLAMVPAIMSVVNALKLLNMSTPQIAAITIALTVLVSIISATFGYFSGKAKEAKQNIEDLANSTADAAAANKELLETQQSLNKSIYNAAKAYAELKKS